MKSIIIFTSVVASMTVPGAAGENSTCSSLLGLYITQGVPKVSKGKGIIVRLLVGSAGAFKDYGIFRSKYEVTPPSHSVAECGELPCSCSSSVMDNIGVILLRFGGCLFLLLQHSQQSESNSRSLEHSFALNITVTF